MFGSLFMLPSLLLSFRARSRWPPPCWPLLRCTNRSRCWVNIPPSGVPPSLKARCKSLLSFNVFSCLFYPAQVSVSFPSSRTCTWVLQERSPACCLRSTTRSSSTCWSRRSRSAPRWAMQILRRFLKKLPTEFMLTWHKWMIQPACMNA